MADAVCRCGAGPHATEPDCCAKGHVLAGNRRTVTHGLYSFRAHGPAALPPDLKVSVDQLRDDLVAAQGGLEELSREPVRAEAVRMFVDCAAGRRLLMNEVIRKGIDSAAGRRAYDGMLQTTDRMLRVAALIGTERRSRQVKTPAERMAEPWETEVCVGDE